MKRSGIQDSLASLNSCPGLRYASSGLQRRAEIMVLYRRNRVAGGTYFFTVTLRDRSSEILIERIDLLRASFRVVKESRPFSVNAIAILPDHLHTLWTLPAGDNDYPGRWRAIKSMFTRGCIKKGIIMRRNAKGEYDLWRRRYWEHTIRNDIDYERHVNYIHYNPVKHGLVKNVSDWPYSSFHHYVRSGILNSNWTSEPDSEDSFGE
jgi:putative transposase